MLTAPTTFAIDLAENHVINAESLIVDVNHFAVECLLKLLVS